MPARVEIEFLDESDNRQWVRLMRRDGDMWLVEDGILKPRLIADALLTTRDAERYLGSSSAALRTWAGVGSVGSCGSSRPQRPECFLRNP
jgi:hypothetical protein